MNEGAKISIIGSTMSVLIPTAAAEAPSAMLSLASSKDTVTGLSTPISEGAVFGRKASATLYDMRAILWCGPQHALHWGVRALPYSHRWTLRTR